MKKRVLHCFLLLLPFLAVSAFGQSADRITGIITTDKLSGGEAAYLAAMWLGNGDPGIAADTVSGGEAIAALERNNLLPPGITEGDAVTLEQFSLLCMRVWNIPGGLMYRLFPSSRYALKELKLRGIIPASADPSFTVSGREALNIISICSEIAEGT
ncbi:MAG: hypothetical protein LBR47_02520 [Spirochaetaceae bacterium]|nr:hypothetical protein [Spirochaetaceae bacterium]